MAEHVASRVLLARPNVANAARQTRAMMARQAQWINQTLIRIASGLIRPLMRRTTRLDKSISIYSTTRVKHNLLD